MALVCRDCGSIGEPETVTKGSSWIEVVLWLCFIVPGLVYSLWRHSSRFDACKACGSRSIVPLDTPVGRELVAKNPAQATRIERARPPRSGAIAFGRSLGRLFAKK